MLSLALLALAAAPSLTGHAEDVDSKLISYRTTMWKQSLTTRSASIEIGPLFWSFDAEQLFSDVPEALALEQRAAKHQFISTALTLTGMATLGIATIGAVALAATAAPLALGFLLLEGALMLAGLVQTVVSGVLQATARSELLEAVDVYNHGLLRLVPESPPSVQLMAPTMTLARF